MHTRGTTNTESAVISTNRYSSTGLIVALEGSRPGKAMYASSHQKIASPRSGSNIIELKIPSCSTYDQFDKLEPR